MEGGGGRTVVGTEEQVMLNEDAEKHRSQQRLKHLWKYRDDGSMSLWPLQVNAV